MAELRSGARGAGLRDEEVPRAAAVLEDLLHVTRVVGLPEERRGDGRLRVQDSRRVAHAKPTLRLVHIETQVKAVVLLRISEIHGQRGIHRPSLGLPVRERGVGRDAVAEPTVGAVGVRHREGVVTRRCRIRRGLATFVDLIVAVLVDAVAGAVGSALFGRAGVDVLVLVVAVALLGGAVAVAIAVAVDAVGLHDVGARAACVRCRLHLHQALLDVVAAAISVRDTLVVALAGRLGVVVIAPVQARGARNGRCHIFTTGTCVRRRSGVAGRGIAADIERSTGAASGEAEGKGQTSEENVTHETLQSGADARDGWVARP